MEIGDRPMPAAHDRVVSMVECGDVLVYEDGERHRVVDVARDAAGNVCLHYEPDDPDRDSRCPDDEESVGVFDESALVWVQTR
ncbi:hypothetical protein [Actinopolyspora halophila]|uniref:hypothetical protein n=1 Tax=Actinopolyspora halophila TaxID=1850 RepID=UPI00037526E4|nr:hypothetical protein [Actinopolyspora halophila]